MPRFQILTYSWSIPKLGHFYNVTFPGDYWHKIVGINKNGDHSFNLKMFLDANYNRLVLFMHLKDLSSKCKDLYFNFRFIFRAPMFACIGMTDKDLSWQQDYVMWPYGPCLRIFRKNATPTPAIWMNTTRDYAKEWPHHFDTYATLTINLLIQT